MEPNRQSGAVLSRRVAVAYFGILVCIAVAWTNSVGGEPVFDDHWLIVRNLCFGNWDRLAKLVTFQAGEHCAYRPVRYLSYGLDFQLWSGDFRGYHVGNIVRHALTTLVAGLLASTVARRAASKPEDAGSAPWIGVAVALLWSLHPVQTDSVSYVSGRRDILVGLFTFASVFAALTATAGKAHRASWWGVAAVLFCLGLLSKENAVAIPVLFVVLLAIERDAAAWIRRRPGTVAALVLLFGSVFALVVWRVVFSSHSVRGVFQWWGGSLGVHLANAVALQGRYVGQALGVYPLIGDYHATTIALPTSWLDVRVVAGATWIVGALGAAWSLRRRMPLFSFGVAWWFVSLGPMAQLIPHHELYAEHYLYTPLWGLVLAGVDAGRRFVSLGSPQLQTLRHRGVALAGVIVALAMVLSVATRNLDWRNERAFYESVWAKAPDNERAMGNLIHIYAEAGQWELANVPCERMAQRWTAGSVTQRTALARCIEAATNSGRADLRLQYSERATADLPDWGVGWRNLAAARFERGELGPALTAAGRWWSISQSPDALEIGARAADALAASRQTVTAEDRAWIVEGLTQTAAITPQGRFAGARMAAALGDSDGALRILDSWQGLAGDPSMLRLYCDVADRAGRVMSACESREGSDSTP